MQPTDIFGEKVNQGDIIIFSEGRHSLTTGVVKSLFWSSTYNKYTGICIARSASGEKLYTTSLPDKHFCKVNPADTSKYDKIIMLCKASNWETQPNRQAPGTKILTSLTRLFRETKNRWVVQEQQRQRNLDEFKRTGQVKDKWGYRSYNRPKEQPSDVIDRIGIDNDIILITFRPTLSKEVEVQIKINQTVVTIPEFISKYNLPPNGVFERINKIISLMKETL